MFREVEKNFEREDLSRKETENYRKIKPNGNLTIEDANAFWANKFAQEAEERRKTSASISLFDLYNFK